MTRTILWGTAGVALAALIAAGGFATGRQSLPSSVAAAGTASSGERAQVEGFVRDYLLANPDILFEMQAALETRQREQQQVVQRAAIEESRDEIFNADHDGIVGNPNGSVTVVEFFDYNCGYCKRALADMEELTRTNPDLRFVLKEFPILGAESQQAHVVSMAFRALAPEKYAEFHRQLLGNEGRANEETAIRIATSLGVDEARLREEMKNPAIAQAFEKTYSLAEKLAISGTPAYVVGNEVVFGALGHEVLAEKIAGIEG